MNSEYSYRTILTFLRNKGFIELSEIVEICSSHGSFEFVIKKLKEDSNFEFKNKRIYKKLEWPVFGFWPLAVPTNLLVKTENDKKTRAGQICEKLILEDLNFLDYGCGEGHVVFESKKNAKTSIGYDIEKQWKPGEINLSDDFEFVKQHAPYDVVLLWDVLDYMENPTEELSKIKEMLSPEGKIYIKCFPWSSRYGCKSEYNLAYIHLCFDDSQTRSDKNIRRLKDPVFSYEDCISSSGFKILEEELVEKELPEFFRENDLIWEKICSNWKCETKAFLYKNIFSHTNFNYGSDNYDSRKIIADRWSTEQVKSLQANGFGLYDMHGNIWEWCLDAEWTNDPPRCLRQDGAKVKDVAERCGLDYKQKHRIIRGGSYRSKPTMISSSSRYSKRHDQSMDDLGFRLLMESELDMGIEWVNSLGINMVKIPIGEFMMAGKNANSKIVCIENSFYMADAPVTTSQYAELTGVKKIPLKNISNSSVYKNYKIKIKNPIKEVDEFPVTDVSWIDSVEFCDVLSSKENKKYRLPTEAEWEYCCRGNISGKLIDILKIQSAFYICGLNNDS